MRLLHIFVICFDLAVTANEIAQTWCEVPDQGKATASVDQSQHTIESDFSVLP